MTKKVSMEDIKSSKPHRSIRDISVSDVGRSDYPETISEAKKIAKASASESKPVRKVKIDEASVPFVYDDYVDLRSEYQEPKHPIRWGKVFMWFVVILVLLGGFVFASSFFHSASVDIKIKEVTADATTTVMLSRKDGSGILSFEIVSLSKEVSQQVPTNGEKQVSDKATGRIVIFNKNTTSQKLLAQTRLESSNGKIYRLNATVTVAGAKKSGTNLVPGSLEVTAVADQPGPDYNSELVDLIFIGFKGTAKYQTVYAKSKTPFAGGALGTVKVADPADLAKAQQSIKDELNNQLQDSAKQQIPNSFILLPNVYSINYASTTQETNGDSLSLKQKADFVGVLVDAKKLSMYLAKNSIPGYSGEDVLVDNLKDLSYTASASTSALTVNTTNLSLMISGKPHFIYGYDADQLKANLQGISRESFATVIATYPAIERGNSKIQPFWSSKFPTDLTKITINEEK